MKIKYLFYLILTIIAVSFAFSAQEKTPYFTESNTEVSLNVCASRIPRGKPPKRRPRTVWGKDNEIKAQYEQRVA